MGAFSFCFVSVGNETSLTVLQLPFRKFFGATFFSKKVAKTRPKS